MTIEEIRKGAPKGATHYEVDEDDEDDTAYYKKTICGWAIFERSDTWIKLGDLNIFGLDKIKPRLKGLFLYLYLRTRFFLIIIYHHTILNTSVVTIIIIA